jgi:hypothetical protein
VKAGQETEASEGVLFQWPSSGMSEGFTGTLGWICTEERCRKGRVAWVGHRQSDMGIQIQRAAWSFIAGCCSQGIHKMTNKLTIEIGGGGGEVAGKEELFWLLSCVGCS